MNQKINRKSNKAFTLVEIIGVLAIIGILAAVVTPRVIDGIREGRITQLSQNLGQWKSGADRYLQKQQGFPIDGQVAPRTQEGAAWVDPRTGAAPSDAQATFGDVLVAQGLASAINVPFGSQGNTRSSFSGVTNIPNVAAVTVSDFPQIRCSAETGTADDNFTATQTRDVPHRVVYLAIPSVPLQEAAAIKSKIDGPFTRTNNLAVPDSSLVAAALARTNTAGVLPAQVEALTRGNCRVGSGAITNTYNLFIYVSND